MPYDTEELTTEELMVKEDIAYEAELLKKKQEQAAREARPASHASM